MTKVEIQTVYRIARHQEVRCRLTYEVEWLEERGFWRCQLKGIEELE
jgi:hypothetical protein